MKRFLAAFVLVSVSNTHVLAESQKHEAPAAEASHDESAAVATPNESDIHAASVGLAFGTQAANAVRRLSRTQDLVILGDEQALAGQAQLLAEADRQLSEMLPAAMAERSNKAALLAYAMSGGNPNTVDRLLGVLPKDDPMARLGRGVVDYMRGSHDKAATVLETFDPYSLSPELGAPLALLQGTLHAEKDPEEALRLYDRARLIAPGTIVEESALRRSLVLTARMGDTRRFMKIARTYALRFVRSPYASQFASTFAAGVAEHSSAIDLEDLENAASTMPAAHRREIYLKIAREAAMRGNAGLTAFATDQAKGVGAEMPETLPAAKREKKDGRLQLYEVLATITSDAPEAILKSLDSVDRRQLAPEDRKLLAAGRALAEALLRPSANEAGRETSADEMEPVVAVRAEEAPGGTQHETETAEKSGVEESDHAAAETTQPDADQTEMKRLDAKMEDWKKRIEKAASPLGSVKT